VTRGKASWGIIGIGQLGASLVEGICRSEAPVKLFLSPRSEFRARELAARFAVVVGADNQAIVDSADHVVLAARPDQVVDVAGCLSFRAGQVVVSVAAVVKQARVQEAIGSATAVRAMPVLSAAVADSPTCIYPANDAAMSLFEHLGTVHAFEDEDTFTAAAVAATYYGWVYALMDTSARWLNRNGVTADTSRALIAEMTRAACNRCLESDRDMGTMAAEIAPPGTFTGIGLDLLRERGALEAWSDACQSVLDACQERER
jgi:pyrroline-5-carboxylate reductase